METAQSSWEPQRQSPKVSLVRTLPVPAPRSRWPKSGGAAARRMRVCGEDTCRRKLVRGLPSPQALPACYYSAAFGEGWSSPGLLYSPDLRPSCSNVGPGPTGGDQEPHYLHVPYQKRKGTGIPKTLRCTLCLRHTSLGATREPSPMGLCGPEGRETRSQRAHPALRHPKPAWASPWEPGTRVFPPQP